MESSVTDRCPWCGSLISRARFIEIEAKIREQERKRLAEAEATMRKQLEQKFQQKLETAKRAAAANEKAEADKRVTSIIAERDRMQEKLKQAEAREATIRKQVQDEAEQRLKREVAQQRAILQKDLDRHQSRARGRGGRASPGGDDPSTYSRLEQEGAGSEDRPALQLHHVRHVYAPPAGN